VVQGSVPLALPEVRLLIKCRVARVAGFVRTARGEVLEAGIGDLNFGSGRVGSHTASSNWQITEKSFEGRVVGPDQLRGANVDVILIECLDIEPVRACTLEPEPITAASKILIGKHLGIDGVRLSIHELAGSVLLAHREILHHVSLTRWTRKVPGNRWGEHPSSTTAKWPAKNKD
jgi:hypothetical protein